MGGGEYSSGAKTGEKSQCFYLGKVLKNGWASEYPNNPLRFIGILIIMMRIVQCSLYWVFLWFNVLLHLNMFHSLNLCVYFNWYTCR